MADTGDDHDVSLAVGRMHFAEYALSGDQPRRLPQGDILVFGVLTVNSARTLSIAVMAGVGAGDGGAATVGSSVRNIYHSYEEIWRARRIIRDGSPFF